MPRSAARPRSRLPSSFRQRLNCLMWPAIRLTCGESLRRTWRVAKEKSLLHLRDDLTRYFKFCADPVDPVGVQPDRRLSDDSGWIELIRDGHPVLAPETSFSEPAADLAPKSRLVRALALDAPANARPAVPGGGGVGTDDS